jgi:hypothetical protein
MSLADTPLRDILANAEVLAESLEYDKRPQSAALIRELIARVVPLKFVPSGGTHPKRLVPDPDVKPVAMPASSWCEQCEKRVTAKEADGCKSRFCKVQS